MSPMRGARWSGGLILLGVLVVCGMSTAQMSTHTPAPEQLQRGQYLVEHVAMCVQCHTPRKAQGELDRTRLLQGAPIPVQPHSPCRLGRSKPLRLRVYLAG